MKDIVVIKIGGSTFGSGDTTVEDIVAAQQQGIPLVVVHGGGSTVTSWLKQQDIPTTFVRGERVTDAPALEVVTAVLAGLCNKQIAAPLMPTAASSTAASGMRRWATSARWKGWIPTCWKRCWRAAMCRWSRR